MSTNNKYPAVVLPGGRIEIMDLTPDFALALLHQLHPHQRPRRVWWIERCAMMMTAQTWRWNGEPYHLDEDLKLINGQHRAAAVAMSGQTQKDAIVITVYDRKAILTIDQGLKRTRRDVLVTSGRKDLPGPVVSAILAEQCDFVGWHHLGREEVMIILDSSTMQAPLKKLARVRKHKRLSSSGVLAGAARVMRSAPISGFEFFKSVVTLDPTVAGKASPQVKLLYTYLMESSGGIHEDAYKCVRAWNAWRRGENLQFLRYEQGARLPEVAP